MSGSAAGITWVLLLALIWLPFPFTGIPVPERGAPIIYLLTAALAVLSARVWAISRPAGALMAYIGGHVLWALLVIGQGHVQRKLHLLGLLVAAAILFEAAAGLARASVLRASVIAVLLGVSLQVALGVLNVFHVYPSPLFLNEISALLGYREAWTMHIEPAYFGHAMGWLTHPNYLGSAIALLVPVAYTCGGRPLTLAFFAGILATTSIGPLVTGLAGLACVMTWTRRRLAGAALALLGLVAIAGVHYTRVGTLDGILREPSLERLTSGRVTIWRDTLGSRSDWRLVVFGSGLGSYRTWADEVNRRLGNRVTLGQQTGPKLRQAPPIDGVVSKMPNQAHNEYLQFHFELGWVGSGLLLWALSDLGWRLWRRRYLWTQAWRVGPIGLDVAWMAVLGAGLVNALGSPAWHLPAQGAVLLFAYARTCALLNTPIVETMEDTR